MPIKRGGFKGVKMAEQKARILRVLEALSECVDPAKAAEVGASIGETPINAGHDLFELGQGGLAEKPDKKKPLWLITDKGRETLENPPAYWVSAPTGEPSGGNLLGKPPGETVVPSQVDIFKGIGDHLGVGTRGDIKLSAVIYYLQYTADMDDLDSVWNALTEMGVAPDVKKRWIKLYSQTMIGKGRKISEELSKKLEVEPEGEKIAVKTEEPPIAKRFNVFNGKVVADPEGEYNFSMAMQKAMVEGGASSSQASEVATTFAKMSQETLTTILPLLTKEPPAQDNTIIQGMQQRIEQLADAKHDAEMESLRAEMRSGQRPPEADQQIQALSQQITEMRETMHNEQLARIQEQNQNSINALIAEMGKLREQVAAGAQGKAAESKIGLMSETVKGLLGEAKGAREDIKSMAPEILGGRGTSPRNRTTKEKAEFGTGLDKGIERARAASVLEDDLFFGKEA